MSSRSLKVTAVWRSDEFVISSSKGRPPQDEAYLIIDEPSEKITVHIPDSFNIISKRIIERRVHSIAKSGFRLPDSDIRVGMNFVVDLSTDDTVPDILLQVGHHYSYERPTEVYIEPDLDTRAGYRDLESKPETELETYSEETPKPDLEYVPSFLTHNTTGDRVSSSETPSEARIPVEPEYDLSLEEILVGRFVVALNKLGDVFLSRTGDNYTVEYTQGNVEFSAKNGAIQVLNTKRVSVDEINDILRQIK
ncbi:MAG: hypothetical protein ACFFE8_16795 [Candidatus Heimdallarchaeota archaeon]